LNQIISQMYLLPVEVLQLHVDSFLYLHSHLLVVSKLYSSKYLDTS